MVALPGFFRVFVERLLVSAKKEEKEKREKKEKRKREGKEEKREEREGKLVYIVTASKMCGSSTYLRAYIQPSHFCLVLLCWYFAVHICCVVLLYAVRSFLVACSIGLP